MMYQTLEIERAGRIATIWMNRPAVFNAFDEQLIAELATACRELDADASVRVVVLGGRGKHFSAGADLNWMKRAAQFTPEQNLDDARKFANMLRTLAQMSKPTIARVQGAALGGGTGLTAACDMAIADTTAAFSTSEVKFGIIPSAISPYVLRAIGPRHALRYFQSAERISAERALAIGLVGEVVAPEALDAAVAQLAETLLQGGPQAQKAAKDLIAAVDGQKIDEIISEETARRIARQRATDEAKDGIAAFLDKRPPAWLA
ncbi:enoyl-CoA hydratase/isomerase family protein [Quatrionicoccus australiensis]|uniref:enoyl-CoA hydratase/isomerase family protein n=1 Tax=Quatrionicoccus australiensis TaxID=138118 RepID=UPI001CF84CE7|nr:enoyl-CoA hydratase/isomerase family protein [Quatrionicoccus australiensis]UCV17056.1 enoyl-CoA hydratase/isomerase family protein [Quatrionicoccus australiensis]